MRKYRVEVNGYKIYDFCCEDEARSVVKNLKEAGVKNCTYYWIEIAVGKVELPLRDKWEYPQSIRSEDG